MGHFGLTWSQNLVDVHDHSCWECTTPFKQSGGPSRPITLAWRAFESFQLFEQTAKKHSLILIRQRKRARLHELRRPKPVLGPKARNMAPSCKESQGGKSHMGAYIQIYCIYILYIYIYNVYIYIYIYITYIYIYKFTYIYIYIYTCIYISTHHIYIFTSYMSYIKHILYVPNTTKYYVQKT